MAAVEKGEKGVVQVEEVVAAAAKEVAGGDMITRKSSDGKTFEVSKEAAKRLSDFLMEKIDGGGTNSDIQLEKIGSKTLEKVVDYFNKHANNSNPSGISSIDTTVSEDLKEWDDKLVDNLRLDALYDLITAATILDMKGLLDACCKRVANMIKGKTPVQVRKMFNIVNDFTAEEEEEMGKESPWAFESASDDEEV